jgi:hypothetical protein
MAPTIRSFQKILGMMIAEFKSKSGITDLYKGSVNLSLIESSASVDFVTEGKILGLINAKNIDKIKGQDLKDFATDIHLSPIFIGSTPSSVEVTVTDSAFSKISSTTFAGSNSPIAGDTVLRVVSAASFPSTGTIQIGRNKASYETISYVSKLDSGSGYWTLSLSSPLVKDHLAGEEVVVSQGGDRSIPAGRIVRVPSASGRPAIEFRILNNYKLLDGEKTLSGIIAVCTEPGTKGRVATGKISEFDSAPWSTATVTNPSNAVGGTDAETDTELRQRIKDYSHTLSRGTNKAIRRSLIGISDSEENKRITSAYVVSPTVPGQYSLAYIDDGIGLTPSFSGTGEEKIINEAIGVEQRLQLQQWPVVKAQLASINTEPFQLSGGESLSIETDGLSEEKTFIPSNFSLAGQATAQEVAEAINSLFTIVEARAKDGSIYLVPVSDDPDYLKIAESSGTDANTYIDFPASKALTLRLYEDDRLLNKNGQRAYVKSKPATEWPIFTASETLQLRVDSIDGPTVTLTDAQFAALTSSVTIKNASALDWVIIINAKFLGVTAEAQTDGSFVVYSNKGYSDSAQLNILSGSLSGTLFSTNATGTGLSSEYSLNRLNGLVSLANRATAGRKYSAGSPNTRGFATNESAAVTSFNIPAVNGYATQMVLVPGAESTIVALAQTGTLTFSAPGGAVQRIVSTLSGHFTSVQEGDWVHLFNAAQVGLYKVYRVYTTSLTNDSVELFDPNPQTSSTILNNSTNLISAFRTSGRPQVVTLPAGAAVTNTAVVASFTAQAESVTASILDDGSIRIQADRYLGSSYLSIPVIAGSGKDTLGFATANYESNDPQVAALESEDLAGLPQNKLTVNTDDITAPFDTLSTDQSILTASFSNKGFLTYFGAGSLSFRLPLQRNNTSNITLRGDAPAAWVGLGQDAKITATDTVQLGESDNMVFLIDADAEEKTFDVPMYVDGTVASPSVPSSTQFDLNDSVGSNMGTSTRWSGYRFADYKLWAKARVDVNSSFASNANIRVVASHFGPNGGKIRFAYQYPSIPSGTATAETTLDTTNDLINISVKLASGAVRSIGTAVGQLSYVDKTGSGPYTYKIQFSSPVDLASVDINNDVVYLKGTQFSALNRYPLKINAVSNLKDSSKSFQHLKEYLVGDSTTGSPSGSAVIFSTTPAQAVQVGDTVTLTGFRSGVTSVGANTITVTPDNLFNTSLGTIHINGISYTYATYSIGSGVFAGMSPNPSGVVNVSDYAVQDVAPVNQQTLAIASYNSGTKTATMSSSFSLEDSKAIVELTHKALTISAGPSFTIAVNDLVQVSGQFQRITTVVSQTIVNIATPYTFSGSAAGTVSRISVTATRPIDGLTESQTLANSDDIQIYSVGSGTASSLIALINNTAQTSSMVTASLQSGSDGTGLIGLSTEDELGNGTQFVSLQNGESFVKVSANSNPCITLKEPTALTLEVGETVRLIPSTPVNVRDHLSKKQISGLSVAADVAIVDNGRRVQVSTKTVGGTGQVYALGGKALGNSTLTVRGSAQSLSSTRGQVELDISALSLLSADHCLKFVQTGRATKSWPVTAIGAADTITLSVLSGVVTATLSQPVVSNYSYTHTSTVLWSVRKLSRGRARYEIYSGTATVPATVKENDWVFIGNGSSYAGATPSTFFLAANRGWFQVRETDNSTYFDVDNASAAEEIASCNSAPFIFTRYHSARVGDQISIGAGIPVSASNKGTFVITDVSGSSAVKFANSAAVAEGPIVLGSTFSDLKILDQGYVSYRRVVMVSAKPGDPSNKALAVVSPGTDLGLLTEGQGARVYLQNRLNFPTTPANGLNGYQYWIGTKRKAQRIINGLASDPDNYPGQAAEGTFVEAREGQIQRLRFTFLIRTKDGVALTSIANDIKSRVIGFVNNSGQGQSVILSAVTAAVQAVPGVESVVMVYPDPATERVSVNGKSYAKTSVPEVTLT